MASNGTTEPLLPAPAWRKDAPKRRTLRRCRSAPMAESVLFGNSRTGSAPPPDTAFFRRVHPNLRRVIMLLTLYLGLATVCFYVASDELRGAKTSGVIDAAYFSIVTMTTVGYGDLVPSSTAAKLLACTFAFSGMALGCLILSSAADYLLEKQEILLVRALNAHKRLDDTELLREAEVHATRYKCLGALIVLVGLGLAGVAFLAAVEGLSALDAFYCVCSTVTTLGYGDVSFSTGAGRTFAVLWILISTVCMAQFFLYVTDLSAENRRRELVKLVLNRKVTNVDLEAADIDDDGKVEVAEFVLYKLKEMGKITQEDISLVMEEFENLDVDQSGTLSTSDIALAQPDDER